MPPRFHPAAEDLLAYASGAAAEWMALLVACHLTLCERCRRDVELLEELGGVLLESAAGAPAGALPHATETAGLRDGESLSRLLSNSSRPVDGPAAQPRAREGALAGSVPRPLHAFFADAEPRWRFLAPGIKHAPLRVADAQVRLLRLGAGVVIPEHGHTGLEWVLVLDGECGDSSNGQRFKRGDLCCSEADKVHAQDVAVDEPCVALVANLGPIVPRTLRGWVLARLTGY